jgi:hypothetical protein
LQGFTSSNQTYITNVTETRTQDAGENEKEKKPDAETHAATG